MKKIISILIVILLMISITPINTFAQEKTDTAEFKGSRKVSYTVDYSDLENYFNGGRSTFDLLLRKYAPSWLKYSLKSKNRDIVINLEFSFESLDDYKIKTEELIAGTSYICYSREKSKILFLESHTAQQLLNFVYIPGMGQMSYDEISIADLFKVSKNSIVINKKEYSGKDKIEILPNGEKPIILDTLSVKTSYNEGQFVREITAKADDYQNTDKLLSRFKKVGKSSKGDNNEVVVEFAAYNLVELNRLTTLCLYVPCNIIEEEQKLKGIKVGVTQTEIFSTELLLSEYGQLSFEYEYPDYYENVKALNEKINVLDNKIFGDRVDKVEYYYERDFSFGGLDIKTDKSDLFGKTKKVITFSAPYSRASLYHNELKKMFEKYLSKGVALNIYDDGATRCYELSFSSWLYGDIVDFATNILGKSYECEQKDSWFPYGKSTIEEKIDGNNISFVETPINNITMTYVFHKSAKFESVNGSASTNEETNTLTISSNSFKENCVEYHRFHLFKCIIDVLGLVVCAILIVFGIKYSKKAAIKIKKLKEENNTKKAVANKKIIAKQKEEIRFCSECGAPVKSKEDLFCNNCGTKLNN